MQTLALVSKFKYSTLSLALTYLVSIPSGALANDKLDKQELNIEPNNTSFNLNHKAQQKLNQVNEFTHMTYSAMVNNITTQKYLHNELLSSSSTFPARLLHKLNKNPWRPAPFLPVPEKYFANYYGIPPYRESSNYDINTTPISIASDEVQGSLEEVITYKGNVDVTQGDTNLKADELNYNKNTGDVITKGNITYSAPAYTISSRQYIKANLNNKTSEIAEPFFQMNGSIASGSSKQILLDDKNNTAILTDTKFSTCPLGDDAWSIKANRIEIERNEAFGRAYGTSLRIKDVPVFYLPYLNFPISNKRKSGLLYPYAAIDSDNGFTYEQPIYFNLAPNYDYTLKPKIMTKRGLLLGNEFRYMPFKGSYGEINLDYLPQDNEWRNSINRDGDDSRYMIRWYHESEFFNRDLVLNIDYQKVRNNDYDYLDDIGADNTNVTDDHLRQSFRLSYDRSKYNLALEVRDYQRLQPDEVILHRPFALLPQLTAQYTDTYNAFTFDIGAEFSKFSSPSDAQIGGFSANRFHFEPAINYQIFNNRGTVLDAELRGFFTHYQQDDLSQMPDYYVHDLGFSSLDQAHTRSLYNINIRGKTTLERKVLDLRHTQTFEPEIKYQYTPYRDQNNIALYDTTDRMSDYYSNFSFRHFTGKDRIADLNNLTFGITSRLLDAHDRELMRVGIAQTYSIVPTRVTLNPNDPVNLYPRSPLSLFFNAAPTNNITTHAEMTYTNETNDISAWNAMAQYKDENGMLMQISYRFAHDGNRSVANNIIDLKQLGITGSIPLDHNINFYLASYYDLEQSRNIDTKVAIKFEESCWSLAFVYENYNQTSWEDLTPRKDHRIGVQFEFKGISAVNITGSVDKNFNDTRLLNYFDPTNLNQ